MNLLEFSPLMALMAEEALVGTAEIDAARREYERPWNWWHNVRTVSSTVAFILCVVAAFV